MNKPICDKVIVTINLYTKNGYEYILNMIEILSQSYFE